MRENKGATAQPPRSCRMPRGTGNATSSQRAVTPGASINPLLSSENKITGCSENAQSSVGKKAEQKGRSSKEGLRETEYKRNLRQRDGEPQFLKGFDVSLFYLFCINRIEIIGAKINEMLLVQKDMVNRKNQTVSNGDYRSFSSAPCGNFGIFRKEITVFVSNR